jgi:hypothetical protein
MGKGSRAAAGVADQWKMAFIFVGGSHSRNLFLYEDRPCVQRANVAMGGFDQSA